MRASCLFALLVACSAVEAKVQTTKAAEGFVYGEKLMAALAMNNEPAVPAPAVNAAEVDSIIEQLAKSVKLMATKKVTSNIAAAIASQISNLIELLPFGIGRWIKELIASLIESGGIAVSTTHFQLKRALNGPVALAPADKEQLETSAKICQALADAIDIDLNTVGFPEQAKSGYNYGIGAGWTQGGCCRPAPTPCPCPTACPCPPPCPPKPVCPCPPPCPPPCPTPCGTPCNIPKPPCHQQPPFHPQPPCTTCGAAGQVIPGVSNFLAPLLPQGATQIPAVQYLLGLSNSLPSFITGSLNFCLISSLIVDIFMVVLSGAALFVNYSCSCASGCGGCTNPLAIVEEPNLFDLIASSLSFVANTVINAVFGPVFFCFLTKAILTFVFWILTISPCQIADIVDTILLIISIFENPAVGAKSFLFEAATPSQGAAREVAAKKAISAVDRALAKVLNVPAESIEGYTPEAFMKSLKSIQTPKVTLNEKAAPKAVVTGIMNLVQGKSPAALFGSSNVFEALATSIQQASEEPVAPVFTQKSCCDEVQEADPLIAAAFNRLQCFASNESDAQAIGMSPETVKYYGQALKNLKLGGNKFIAKELEELQQTFDPAYVQKKSLVEAMAC